MTLTDKQKQDIEKEAKQKYHRGEDAILFVELQRQAYIDCATTYATALNGKDEEIARLRKALGRIEQYSDSGSYATAIVEMKVIATEALKQ